MLLEREKVYDKLTLSLQCLRAAHVNQRTPVSGSGSYIVLLTPLLQQESIKGSRDNSKKTPDRLHAREDLLTKVQGVLTYLSSLLCFARMINFVRKQVLAWNTSCYLHKPSQSLGSTLAQEE